MIMSVLVLVFSSALFFFYLQAFCERVLRREFTQPYCQDIIKAIQLEYPRLLESSRSKASVEYLDARLALKCDFMTLEYLLKSADRTERHLSRREKILFRYFRFLLFCLPIRHALKLQENEAVLKLATILQFFANLVGERLAVTPVGSAVPNPQS